MLIGTSTKIVSGQQKNITKNFSIGDLTDFVRANVSLDDVLAVNNVSTRDAKIGSLYLYDTPLSNYGNITLSQNAYSFYTVANGEVFRMRRGLFRVLSTGGYNGNFAVTGLTQDRSWEMPDKDGVVAMTSDIPSLSGYVPSTRTLTINGVTYDLSANRSWTISTSGGEWGDITGNILDQEDLITYLEENYYPLNSNPAGYLTQSEVEEYPSLASFPPTGTTGVIYIALDTGLFYSWNGSTYISSAPPDTGITGGGIINRIPKFTPNGVTIGNSNFSDDGLGGKYNITATSYLGFYSGGNTWLRLQRASTNRMEFILGNPGISQTHQITSSISTGFEIISTFGYVSLKSGTNDGVKVLDTGKVQLPQVPDTGTTSDFILLRDSSGNVKQIAYPTIPSLSGYVPYTGATSDVDLGVYGLTSEFLQLNTSPTTYTPAVGRIGWNNTDGTLEFKLKGNNVTLQIGQEQVLRVVNKEGSNLLEANYQCVRVRTQAEGGAAGQRLAIKLAQANTKANHSGILGLVTETINNNQEGFITTNGQINKIDTTGSLQGETWLDGDALWLSETVAGQLTNIEPTIHPVQIGYVVYAHANNGKIFVSVQQGVDELSELHDVDITSPANGEILKYNSTLGVWENKPSGGGSIKLSSQTLTAASWTLVGSYYQYTFTNANIVSTGYVDFTPNNASVLEVTTCKMLPEITANNGNCVFYSQFPPQNDIVGEIIIHVL